MLPRSKYVYSMFAGSDCFDLASQEITTYRARFPKPVFRYKVITLFGPNIVASEGAEWKKYRKIAAPAFSEVISWLCLSPDAEYYRQKNNKLVWDETIRIMMDLFDNVWGDGSEVVVDHCLDVTLPVRSLCFRRSQTLPMSQRLHQIALFVISVAGNLYPILVAIIS